MRPRRPPIARLAPLVGRRVELARVRACVAEGSLVSLVGPPGAGKTRLAHAVLGSRAGRGHFVDLSTARSALDVVRALAGALAVSLPRVREGADERGALEPLVSHVLDARALASPRTLVVLDNCEQVVGEVAWLLAAWPARAAAHVLVTSREALRIAGEQVVELGPLEVPDAGAAAEVVLANDAVALVLQRAQGLVVGPEDAPRLASLVRKLDGLPLALELVASRIAVLGLRGVEERLATSGRGETLDLLAHGRRDASARQATLRGAIEWSHRLLDEGEARVLAALALFRGAFAPEDAVAARPRDMTEHEALAALQSLVEKSLVARTGAPRGRLRLLEAIREHAAEQPRDGGTEQRLARHLAARSRAALAEVGTRRARAALGWLAGELENLLALHDALGAAGASDPDDHPGGETVGETLAALLLGVDAVVTRVGPGGLHASRLDRTLALGLAPRLQVALRMARARVHRDGGAMEEGERELGLALEQADAASRAAVRAELGEAMLARGALDDAEATLELALDEARRDGARAGEQKALARLGLVLHARGRLDEAQAHYEAALDLAARLASPALEAAAHRDLGNLLLQRGLFARARAHYGEALARAPHDDLRLEGVVRGNLGVIALEEGDLESGAASFKRALECLRRIGDRTFEAHLLVYAGLTQFERGTPGEARALYEPAIDTLAEVGDVRMEGIARAARAVALAANGELGAADNDLAVAARRLAEVDDPALLALLEVSGAHVGLLRATVTGEVAEARQHAERAALEAEPFAARSDDLRFARRALRRALPVERFVFDAGGTGFVAPDGSRIDLSRRATLARILEALARKRLELPGEPASFEELVAAGWPGERVMPLAAQNRLRVAVTTLRNMGLRQILVFRDGGHLLDPSVPVSMDGG